VRRLGGTKARKTIAARDLDAERSKTKNLDSPAVSHESPRGKWAKEASNVHLLVLASLGDHDLRLFRAAC
jgi:hypothetical protein